MSGPVRAALFDSPVGPLVITADGDAIVRIDWTTPDGDRPNSGGPDSSLLARAGAQLAEYFAGARRAFDLPLAPAGTAFQRRVWDALARIPWGETATYGEIAARVGSAPRAVGGACGANPIPIVIPCHRVLAGGGRAGGYSGGAGIATKAALLRLEGVDLAAPERFAAAL